MTKELSKEDLKSQEHLSALARRLNIASTSSKGSNDLDNIIPHKSDPLLQKIFAVFKIWYGASWTQNVANDELFELTRATWIKGLKNVTKAEIEFGLTNLKTGYAPDPDKFKQWCGVRTGQHKTAAYKDFDKSKAIELKGSPEVASQYISKIKDMLSK